MMLLKNEFNLLYSLPHLYFGAFFVFTLFMVTVTYIHYVHKIYNSTITGQNNSSYKSIQYLNYFL